MHLAKFMSSSIYYVPSAQNFQFYNSSNQFINLNNNVKQGIVYTSDMTLNSCYPLEEGQPSPTYSMVTLSLTSLATTIYEVSSVTLSADSGSTSTKNLN
jgi:hypothetical protein